MAGIESPETARTVLGEMSVSVSLLKASLSPAGFSEVKPVGQYNVVKNNETGEFKSYKSDTERPTFPRIIDDFNNKIETQLEVFSVPDDEYLEYYQKKLEHFATWIYKHIGTNNNSTLPNFIGFGRRLADALVTPCAQRGRWDFHAAKFENSIFFWADPNSLEEVEAKKLMDIKPGYGFPFEGLLTEEGVSTSTMDLLYKKPLVVHERTFGDRNHSLLLVSDIDAEDDEGKWIEMKIYEKHYLDEMDECRLRRKQPSEKAFSCWSQCLVAGAQRVIVGKSDAGRLIDIRDQDLKGFEKMISILNSEVNLCYDFLDQFLEFVSKKFEEQPRGCCLQFMWNSKEEIIFKNGRERQDKKLRKVKCIQATEKELPKWFNDLCTKLTQKSTSMNKSDIFGLDYVYLCWLVGLVCFLGWLICWLEAKELMCLVLSL